MNVLSRIALASTLALSLATTACGSSVDAAPAVQSAAAATRAPVAQGSHGIVKLVGEALGDVELRPDQRVEIEKLAKEADARHASMRAELRAVMLGVADQVERGAVDRASLTPKIDAAIAKVDQVRPLDRAAFVRLHGILDDAQRAAFVEALKARMHDRMAQHPLKHPLLAMANEIGLSSEQRDKIRDTFRASFPDFRGHEGRGGPGGHEGPGARGGFGHGRQVLEAFKQPNFDPDVIAPQGNLAEKAKARADGAFALAEKVLPLLTAEQRKLVAAKIRARASAEDPMEPF